MKEAGTDRTGKTTISHGRETNALKEQGVKCQQLKRWESLPWAARSGSYSSWIPIPLWKWLKFIPQLEHEQLWIAHLNSLSSSLRCYSMCKCIDETLQKMPPCCNHFHKVFHQCIHALAAIPTMTPSIFFWRCFVNLQCPPVFMGDMLLPPSETKAVEKRDPITVVPPHISLP